MKGKIEQTHQLLQGLCKLERRQARHALLPPVGQEALRIEQRADAQNGTETDWPCAAGACWAGSPANIKGKFTADEVWQLLTPVWDEVALQPP